MRWLLRLLLTDADRRAIETDLAELFELRRRQDGDRAATRWLRRQQVLLPVHLLLDRVGAAFSSWRTVMRHLWRDVFYSGRAFARTPALTATIVLTVGVGLGATTAMVTIVRAVLVNPLPYAAPESLFWIYTDTPPFRFRFSVVDYRALEADHPSFSSVAAYQTTSVTVTESGLAERVTAKAVTGSYFPLMQQRPLAGRLFDAPDDSHGDGLVVLTAKYWAERFSSDVGAIGRAITIDGVRRTIVGVLQEDVGPLERGVALFTVAKWPTPKRKGPFFVMVLGRLRPDVSRAAALDTLRATNARLFPIWKSSYQDEKATWGIQDLKARVIGNVGSTMLFIMGAVACVLLIACANAINLLIARALNRSRELAIRSALGASRARLMQQLLVETGVLTAAAALTALVIAIFAVRMVATYGVTYVPRINEVRLSAASLGWLAALAVFSGLLMFAGGLVPAIQSSRLRLDRSLRAGGRSTTDGPAGRRLRRTLVAAEFALATPLLIAAALVLLSLDRLGRVPVGIDTGRVLTGEVSLSSARYPEDSDRKAFWDRALMRLAALPGVEAVALSDSRPPQDAGNTNNFNLEDRPAAAGENQPLCTWVGVSPGFFKTVGLPIERGRGLDDRSAQQNLIVVDRAWRDRFFPGQEVVGRRLKEGGCTDCPWTTVVGLVGTVKWQGLENPDQGTVYYPFVDQPETYFVLRGAVNPGSLAPALTRAVRELDPELALTNVATGYELVSDSLAAPRYLTVLVGIFALAALILSVVGIYGVMAYFVQQHTRDIGIRLALGGEPAHVRRMVVFQGLRLVIVGVVVGSVAALLTARSMTTVLFDVSPTDPATMAGVPLALLATAALACLVTGRRAAKLDPAEILRDS